jgi:hypothetical protein
VLGGRIEVVFELPGALANLANFLLFMSWRTMNYISGDAMAGLWQFLDNDLLPRTTSGGVGAVEKV